MQIKIFFILLIFNSFLVFSQERIEVFFDFNQHKLNAGAVSKLNSWIVNNDNIEVSKIYGFCDWVGSNQFNDTLSIKRVNEVFKFLTDNKIPIKTDYLLKGFGENFEQSKNQSENRKVTIIYEPIRQVSKDPVSKKEPTFSETIKIAKPGDRVKLQNINFYNNSARIVPKSMPVLYELLCVLEENPDLKIEIQGHICCQTMIGVHDVSTARARAIYSYLLRNKINRKRLTFKGYGNTMPIHPIPENNESEENENRRVEILILEN